MLLWRHYPKENYSFYELKATEENLCKQISSANSKGPKPVMYVGRRAISAVPRRTMMYARERRGARAGGEQSGERADLVNHSPPWGPTDPGSRKAGTLAIKLTFCKQRTSREGSSVRSLPYTGVTGIQLIQPSNFDFLVWFEVSR